MKKVSYKNVLRSGLVLTALLTTPALADTAGNWSGSYIGAHGGYDWGDFRNRAGIVGPDSSHGDWLGGAQIGNNWQADHIVFGIEGDASALDAQSRNQRINFREDWMATVRGRVGYSFNQLLPYVTAGWGMTDVTEKIPGLSGSTSNIRSGLAIGGGVDFLLTHKMDSEYASNHWIGRLEYLHVDVPRDTDTVNGVAVNGGSSNNIVRIGLNYRFY